MKTMYFVEICQHNGKTDAWNYKQTKAFDDISEARKEFHNQLSTYINYGDLDHVGVILWDSYTNVLAREYWQKEQVPTAE